MPVILAGEMYRPAPQSHGRGMADASPAWQAAMAGSAGTAGPVALPQRGNAQRDLRASPGSGSGRHSITLVVI
jgi:hypothetical protein